MNGRPKLIPSAMPSAIRSRALGAVIVAVEQDLARIDRAHRRADRRGRDCARRSRLVRLAKLDPRHLQLFQPLRKRREDGGWIGILDALRIDVRREADADTVHADRVADRLQNLGNEAQAVLDRAAIFVGPEVGAVAKELVDQIAVGAVDLDAVEAGGDGVAGGRRIVAERSGGCRRESLRALPRTASCLRRCGRNRARSSLTS